MNFLLNIPKNKVPFPEGCVGYISDEMTLIVQL